MVRRHMVRGIPRSALAASLLALVVASATARADVRPGGPGGAPVPFTAATRSTLSGPATPALAWCGTGETPENRLPQSTLPSADTIRIGYAVPADAPDRFGELANGIVSDISAIDQWWQSQDPTRTPRWDTYAFPGCTATLSDLDLSVFRLAHDSAWYAAPNGYSRVVDEIASHLDASEKAVVFFDGAFDDPLVCGESMAAPRNGGAYGVSVIALRSSCGSDLGAGSYTARIAAHELTHNLGAVPIEGPPDRCVDPRVGGHVCDSETDLMYPYAFAGMQLADAALDIDHDDYYRHSGAWWDVQDSAWLVHLPLRTLTLAVSGPGSVSSTVAGIACAATCPVKLDDRSEVRLDAVSATGAELAAGAAPAPAAARRARLC